MIVPFGSDINYDTEQIATIESTLLLQRSSLIVFFSSNQPRAKFMDINASLEPSIQTLLRICNSIRERHESRINTTIITWFAIMRSQKMF